MRRALGSNPRARLFPPHAPGSREQPHLGQQAVDALRLEQAARNLLEHAITFSPGGCLDVSVQQVAGDQVELVVWDRGLEGWRRRSGRTSSSPFTRRMGAATEGRGLRLAIRR